MEVTLRKVTIASPSLTKYTFPKTHGLWEKSSRSCWGVCHARLALKEPVRKVLWKRCNSAGCRHKCTWSRTKNRSGKIISAFRRIGGMCGWIYWHLWDPDLTLFLRLRLQIHKDAATHPCSHFQLRHAVFNVPENFPWTPNQLQFH